MGQGRPVGHLDQIEEIFRLLGYCHAGERLAEQLIPFINTLLHLEIPWLFIVSAKNDTLNIGTDLVLYSLNRSALKTGSRITKLAIYKSGMRRVLEKVVVKNKCETSGQERSH